MADTPLFKKLGIRPKHQVLILNAPEGYRNQLGTLPADAELITTPTSAGNFDVVHLFVRNKSEVERDVPSTIQLVKPGGLLWISYPWIYHLPISYNLMERMNKSFVAFSRSPCFRQ